MKYIFIAIAIVVSGHAVIGNVEDEVMEVYQALDAAPLWGNIEEDANDAARRFDLIAACFTEISKKPIDVIRKALVEWLGDADDQFKLSYRIDNAQILCGFVFELPEDHPFRAYFFEESGGSRIRAPGFLDDLNKGRPSIETATKNFFHEFDALSAKGLRRTVQ